MAGVNLQRNSFVREGDTPVFEVDTLVLEEVGRNVSFGGLQLHTVRISPNPELYADG